MLRTLTKVGCHPRPLIPNNLLRNNVRTITTSRWQGCNVIGIDLGTTNSCVAVIQGEDQVVIENDGKRTTPSYFAIDKEGNRLVGQPAQRQMVVNPQNTFYGVKRLIGRRFDDKETKVCQEQVSYNIVSSPNGDAWVADAAGKTYAPSEIASNILMKLKEVAEEYLQGPVNRAVITVPAYFDNHQRKATEDAGTIAGLQVDRIINEPTAAALAYGINKSEDDKVIVVYDLGGGTFDVSILQIGGGVFEVRSTAGDTFLGGEDFTNVLTEYLISEFKKTEKVDLAKDKVALQRVREAAELAKHDLSTRTEVMVNLPYITMGSSGQPLTLDVKITRAKFEEKAAKLVQKSIIPCKKALADADLEVEDVTDVIMVGGMTRMPKVRQVVKDFFKQEPSLGVNPDEAVAIGAALQGTIIQNQGLMPGEEERELVLVDVTPLNLGIKVHTGEMAVIVPAQTAIPCSMSHSFTTVTNFQTTIATEVYQGNRPMADQNRLIGQYTMTGIPSAPAGVPKIDVTFDISANGTITVTSRDRASQAEQNVIINMSSGLSAQEIERMKRDAELNKANDAAAKELAGLKNEVHKEVTGFKSGLEAQAAHIPEDAKEKLTKQIKKVEELLEANKPKKEIQEALSVLKESATPIFAAAYASAAQESNQNQQTE